MKKTQVTGKSGSMYMMADLPECDRPRERLIKHGTDVLNDTELVAILLKSGPRGCSTLDLARGLVKHFDDNLEKLATAEVTELQCIHGIGPAKAAELKAAFTLAQRLASRINSATPKFSTPQSVAEYVYERYRGKKQEEVYVMSLNGKNGLISIKQITKGLLDGSLIHSREVFRLAIMEAAAKIILIHNHPSGDPTPSPNDVEVTKKILKAGNVIEIPLVDHVIVGKKEHSDVYFTSLRDMGIVQ